MKTVLLLLLLLIGLSTARGIRCRKYCTRSRYNYGIPHNKCNKNVHCKICRHWFGCRYGSIFSKSEKPPTK
uniref:Uncharacterized protein n=1 Tax=Ciona savignyi TaxID=51511 RepID=H2YX10_CIOSA